MKKMNIQTDKERSFPEKFHSHDNATVEETRANKPLIEFDIGDEEIFSKMLHECNHAPRPQTYHSISEIPAHLKEATGPPPGLHVPYRQNVSSEMNPLSFSGEIYYFDKGNTRFTYEEYKRVLGSVWGFYSQYPFNDAVLKVIAFFFRRGLDAIVESPHILLRD
ncbi:miaB [Acrasis kona]|uniref:MiaB n=1 Tax=Acrasis kona TaxID=1008807 RepID=A0AAW2ZNP2_9EUKA